MDGPSRADLDRLRAQFESRRDGESGSEYGAALEQAGRLNQAEAVFRWLIDEGFLIGYWDLAWLELGRGRVRVAQSLLEQYLALEDDPIDRALPAGVLGHWYWDFDSRLEAEPLLREGADRFAPARADLAQLLRRSDREGEAEAVLREGAARGEVESFLPLGNLLDESGRTIEAERIYRLGFALGDAHSAYNLHLMLARQERNDEAREWLWLAAEGGDERAIGWLANEIDGEAES